MLLLDTTLASAESAAFSPSADFTMQASIDAYALPTVTIYGRNDTAAAYQVVEQWKPWREPLKKIAKYRDMKIAIGRNIAGRQARIWSEIDAKEQKLVSGYRLGVIGTSLCQQNDLGATTPEITHSSRGWMSWARFYSQGLFTCPIWYDPTVYTGWEPGGAGTTRYFQGLNAGVFAQTTQQMLARKDFLTKKIDCDIIVIDAGTNDLATDAKELIQQNREDLANYYLEQGKLVILFPILARTVVPWPGGGATRARANWINSKTRDFCRGRKNCYFFDWNEKWVDNASTYGTPIAGYTADGTHFVPKGGEAVGKAFADFLKEILPVGQKRVSSPDDLYNATDNPRGNMLANPFLIGTAGANGTGASGTVATGYRVERISGASTVVNSLETRADGRGNYQVLTITNVGTAEDQINFRPSTQDTAHTLPDTEWLQASCEIETNGYAGFIAVTLVALDMISATPAFYAHGMKAYNNGSANEKLLAQARAGIITTPPFKVSTGSTAIRWRVEVKLDANIAGPAVVKIGAVELRPVDNPKTALNWVSPAA